jgi:uncharacterized membrane protein YraQ (UPF0718 family)
MMAGCCAKKTPKKKVLQLDPVLHGSVATIVITLALSFTNAPIPQIDHLAHTILEFLKTMWWGILLGVLFVGVMNKIPREYFNHILGSGDTFKDIIKAAIAGVLLDLCSHGILMVGAKLYERGASYAQLLTFLIASPWNSFSLTIILIALIGFKWTAIYILASMVIAIITGVIVMRMTNTGKLPTNPNTVKASKDFNLKDRAKNDLKQIKWSPRFIIEIFTGSTHELKILLKWLLLGVILAAAIRTYIPLEFFQNWFGPTAISLFFTLIAASIVEVCSEGSAPIASEMTNTAAAPGNGFTFLMAGVSTDYTEIMVLKDTTKSWKMAFILPLLSVPQIVILGYIFNVVTL